MYIEDSIFSNNSVLRDIDEIHDSLDEADTDGGALAVHEANLTIIASSFHNNIAGDDGGAISTRQANIDISNSEFVSNKAISDFASVTLPSLVDDIFTGYGGGIAIQNENADSHGNIGKRTRLVSSKFINNQSPISSAVHISSAPGSETIVEDCLFRGNGGNAQADPNASFSESLTRHGRVSGALTIVGSRSGDRALNAVGDFVRPLHHAIVSKSIFRENEASMGGAAMFSSANVDVVDSIFAKNTARTRAGAIMSANFGALFDQAFGWDPDLGEVTISHSTFEDNITLGILDTAEPDSFPSFVFVLEQPFGGGAISNDQGAIMKITDSRFLRNEAVKSDGGAIHNVTSPLESYTLFGRSAFYPGRMSISRSQFEGNRTSLGGSGGAIANGGNHLNGGIAGGITRSDLRDYATPAAMMITDSKFVRNASVDYGGAIVSWNGSELNGDRNRYISNVADFGGAAAFMGRPRNNGSVTFVNSVLVNNDALSSLGTAIYSTDAEGSLSGSLVSAEDELAVIDLTGQLDIQISTCEGYRRNNQLQSSGACVTGSDDAHR